MATPTHFKLNTGDSIPAVGLGTWQAAEGEVGRAVQHALQNGYRHLDCALIYQNEKEIGEAIKASGVPRRDIFITSKLWNTYHSNVSESLEQSLRDLQTDYLDLYLVHWPVRLIPNAAEPLLPKNPDGTRAVDLSWDQKETWKQMEAIYRSGKVKAIGVSNFSVPYLEDLATSWTVVPAVNQVELHPYNPQHKLKEWCNSRGILLEAYCPLGSTGAPLLSDETVTKLAAKHGVSPAAILISYHVNKGSIVLPKSVTPSRINDNLKVISLPGEDVASLDALAANGKQKRINTPLWGHDLDYALAAATAFTNLGAAPDRPFRFVYVSGEGATQTLGRFSAIFARVKGETEQALADIAAGSKGALRADSVRPGFVDAAQHDTIKSYIPDPGFLYRATTTVLGPVVRAGMPGTHSPTPMLGSFLAEMAMRARDASLEASGAFRLGPSWIVPNAAIRKSMGFKA